MGPQEPLGSRLVRIRVTLAVTLIALMAALAVPSDATADAVSDKRAQASRIAADLDSAPHDLGFARPVGRVVLGWIDGRAVHREPGIASERPARGRCQPEDTVRCAGA